MRCPLITNYRDQEEMMQPLLIASAMMLLTVPAVAADVSVKLYEALPTAFGHKCDAFARLNAQGHQSCCKANGLLLYFTKGESSVRYIVSCLVEIWV